jgi:hypothetical protein
MRLWLWLKDRQSKTGSGWSERLQCVRIVEIMKTCIWLRLESSRNRQGGIKQNTNHGEWLMRKIARRTSSACARGKKGKKMNEQPEEVSSGEVDTNGGQPLALHAALCSAWHRTADKHPPPLTEVEITHPNFIGTRIGMFYPLSMRLGLTDCTHPAQNSYVPIEGSAWRLLPNVK